MTDIERFTPDWSQIFDDCEVAYMIKRKNGAYVRYKDHAARIAELEAAQSWQPIETAPKGMHCLFYGNTRHDNGIVFTGWVARNGSFYEDKALNCWPSHWMPLPAPPKGSDK